MRFKYVLSEVATGLWRNVTMTIAMMITMAVSLTMLGASLLLYLHVNKMKDYYFARVEVSIFLKNEITPEQRDSLGEDLKSNPLVKSVQYVSKEEAYKQFQVQFKDAPDLVAATKPDSLPESFRVKLKNPKQFQQVSDQYKTRDGVCEVVDQGHVLERREHREQLAEQALLVDHLADPVARLVLVGDLLELLGVLQLHPEGLRQRVRLGGGHQIRCVLELDLELLVRLFLAHVLHALDQRVALQVLAQAVALLRGDLVLQEDRDLDPGEVVVLHLVDVQVEQQARAEHGQRHGHRDHHRDRHGDVAPQPGCDLGQDILETH